MHFLIELHLMVLLWFLAQLDSDFGLSTQKKFLISVSQKVLSNSPAAVLQHFFIHNIVRRLTNILFQVICV